MGRAVTFARRVGLWIVGLFPLGGALASILFVLWTNGRLQQGAARGLGQWLVASLSHPIGAIVLVQALYVALQCVLWQRYRPFERALGAAWPKVTVVIPAFNEGPMVERSIRSVARSHYPAELLEIIVVDDGSRDDTFFHMQHLRREFPSLVRLIRFRGNRGKRAALEAGFRAATGEILMTIDSDSEIDPETVHEMVTPFLADARVGAVAGRVAVLNRDSVISRMLEVQYALAFDFGRA
ncbi:MAG TPA: glycosyltransferase family 2 protein, partial [Polyangiaceae bacterium]|nr:glycosyltransferase family 2 protein [Polyangiaceae bacterium]